jgi:nitrate reductase NapD
MRIASLIVKAVPKCVESLKASLEAIPGVEVQAADKALGRLIVTVEDGPGWSTADSLLRVQATDHVMSVTLAYEYSDEVSDLQEMPS